MDDAKSPIVGAQQTGDPPVLRQRPSYFWGNKNVPFLYLFFPLLVVTSGLELLLFFPKVNLVIIETCEIVPSILVGIILLGSARRFNIEIAEAQPIHSLTRWERVRAISNVALVMSGVLAAYAVAAGSLILKGNFLTTFTQALGILYLFNVYTMLLPIRFWSPRPTDFARMYLAATLERKDSEAKFLESALRWFSRSYAEKTHLRLRPRVFTSALSLDHEGRRTLALRLAHAVKSDDYDDGISALIVSINLAREAVLISRGRIRGIVENEMGKVLVAVLVGLAVLVVVYASAIVLGPSSVDAFRSEIGLVVLGAVSVAAIVWTGLRK